jgi:hypothetical protein
LPSSKCASPFLRTYQEYSSCSRAYPGIENYSAGQARGQINNFPDGQFVATLEFTIVGYCASSRIDEAVALAPHDWATHHSIFAFVFRTWSKVRGGRCRLAG